MSSCIILITSIFKQEFEYLVNAKKNNNIVLMLGTLQRLCGHIKLVL